jgi:hypothetical protein
MSVCVWAPAPGTSKPAASATAKAVRFKASVGVIDTSRANAASFSSVILA